MSIAVRIAIRYLLAKKSRNIINIIAWISVIGVMIGAFGLLIVLSVFNGLHDLVGSLYGSFDPDLKVTPRTGKVFSTDSINYEGLVRIEGVDALTEALEDHTLFRFGKRQVPGLVLGVDDNFNKVSSIDSIIVEGESSLRDNVFNKGILGYALADQLGYRLNFVTPLMLYTPERTKKINPARPDQAFTSSYVNPSGIFMVNQIDYDANYVIIHIDQARQMLSYDTTIVSWLGIKLSDPLAGNGVKEEVKKTLGENFLVQNREEQHETFYKMMAMEKLIAYLILSFILLIAIFNVISTLSMLIFEKRHSISTLRSMGADRKLINRIFLTEGWLISLAGAGAGLGLGLLAIWLQQTFGLIRFSGEGTFIVEYYPVILRWRDVLLVFVTVSVTGFLAAWYPVRSIVNRYYTELQKE